MQFLLLFQTSNNCVPCFNRIDSSYVHKIDFTQNVAFILSRELNILLTFY